MEEIVADCLIIKSLLPNRRSDVRAAPIVEKRRHLTHKRILQDRNRLQKELNHTPNADILRECLLIKKLVPERRPGERAGAGIEPRRTLRPTLPQIPRTTPSARISDSRSLSAFMIEGQGLRLWPRPPRRSVNLARTCF